jgi:uncharacterized membrane protein YkoI
MCPMKTLTKVLPGILILLLALLPAVRADDDWRSLHGDVQAGRLVSLGSVLDWLDEHYTGHVIEVELDRDDGKVYYEIEMVGPQGQVVEFEFDAATGELVGIEGVNINGMKR